MAVGGITMMIRIEPASGRCPVSVTRKYSSASTGVAKHISGNSRDGLDRHPKLALRCKSLEGM